MARTLMIWIAAFCVFAYAGREARAKAPETAQLESVASDLISRLSKGDFSGAAETFDPAMKRALPAKTLEQVWLSILGQAGAYEQQAGVRSGKLGPTDIVYVTCKFKKAALDAKIAFNSKQQVSGLWFVPSQAGTANSPKTLPAYLNSDAFTETEVLIGPGPSSLPGTLTRPKGTGPFPAVVLVHGSGPQDRDETIGPNKPFRDLAYGLAANGIAVLRYDKRANVFPEQMAQEMDKMTIKQETIDDALLAVELLRDTESIDANRVFILGHSLGGFAAPRIVKKDPRIAGLVIMAGSTRPLEDVILGQFHYIFKLDGIISPQEKATLDTLKLQVARVKDPKLDVARFASENLPLGLPVSYWRDLRAYDPVKTAKGLSQPIFILQGGRDYQVTKADYKGWRNGLRSRKNVKFRFYTKLNHLFNEGKGRITPTEYEQPGHVSEQVVNDISQWVQRWNQVPGKRGNPERRQ